MRKIFALSLVVTLLLAGCGPTERTVQTGSVIESYDFETPGSFLEGSSGGGATLGIENGTYILVNPSTSVIAGTSTSPLTHTDVVIEVQGEATTTDASYGILCRVDPSTGSGGYLFEVRGDGGYFIMRGDGDTFHGLSNGNAPSGAVNSGQNTVRAVCVGSYLALYANGRFIASADDSTYGSGIVGLAGDAGPSAGTQITFDNLTVYEGALQ